MELTKLFRIHQQCVWTIWITTARIELPEKVLAAAAGWLLVTQQEVAQMEGKEYPAQVWLTTHWSSWCQTCKEHNEKDKTCKKKIIVSQSSIGNTVLQFSFKNWIFQQKELQPKSVLKKVTETKPWILFFIYEFLGWRRNPHEHSAAVVIIYKGIAKFRNFGFSSCHD